MSAHKLLTGSWTNATQMTPQTREGSPCVTGAGRARDDMSATNVILIKDTSMSPRCAALPVLHTATACVPTCAVCGHRNRRVNNTSVHACVHWNMLKKHIPVSSFMRHSLHNPSSSTWTFSFPPTERSYLTLVYCILLFALSALTSRYYTLSEATARGVSWRRG